MLGGYGQLQYKNKVQRYDFTTKQWEIVQPKGDAFKPRYLAALGTNAATDTAYILGGYGSNTGDQTINPTYNYDLLAYSVKDRSFTQLYHLKESTKEFCFANSLIIDSASKDFYALTYPIDRFNSSLQLIKGSLLSPNYQLVGTSIPYLFHDVESFADLYYCAASQKLVAVTIFSPKNDLSTVNIFTIDFPPNSLVPATVSKTTKPAYWLYILSAAFIVIAFLFFILKNKKKTKHSSATHEGLPQQQLAAEPIVIEPVMPMPGAVENAFVQPVEVASIFLFGQFEVISKDGTDITKQFTPLLKELFLLILIYTLKDGRGISSEQLYEKLWSDKSVKDARNNFSVNIVKLKAVLEKVGESYISKESGKWKFEVVNNLMKIDYQKFISLTVDKSPITKNYIVLLYQIVGRGSFLREAQYNWLDDVKSDVSNFVIAAILKYISAAPLQAEAEFIVKLTNCIFFFDQLNEEALEYKCRSLILLGRHGMAKEAHAKFAKEYRENYGEDFAGSLQK